MTKKIDPVRSFEYVLGNGLRNSLRPLFKDTEEGRALLEKETDNLLIKIMKDFSRKQGVRALCAPLTINKGQDQACIIVSLAGHVTPMISPDDMDQYYEHLKVLWEHPQWKMPENLEVTEPQ